MAIKKIGFIGLGAMGQPMAARLLAHDFHVTSCVNVNRTAIDALGEQGLIERRNPHDVANAADAVIVMVRDEKQTDSVLDGDNGALTAMAPGSVLMLMSTLSPGYCKDLAERISSQGVSLLDVPVSGLPARADEGTLSLMAGGDQAALEKMRSVLETMGTIYPCGGVGMGMVAKLANNIAVVGAIALVGEVTQFGTAYGLDAPALLDILSRSTGDSFAVRHWDELRGVWPHIKDLAAKDLAMAVAAAAAQDVAMPLAVELDCYPWPETY